MNANSKQKGNGRAISKPKKSNKGNQRYSNKGKITKPLAEKLDNKGRDNDPNWYFDNVELATQASELSFQAFLGDAPLWEDYVEPTVAVALLNPCPGNSYAKCTEGALVDSDKVMNNGINIQANKIYTMLSTYTGRITSYAPQDVGIMLLAIASMAEISEHIRRAFGVLLTYNERNRFVPKGLIKAMGIDPDDMIANLSNYRMRFNVDINRINQIPLLDNIGFIRKSRELFQRVYLDDISSMAQLFLYAPMTAWVLDETFDDNGSCLRTKRDWHYEDPVPLSKFLGVFEEQIEALLTSTTLNIIYADLLNLATKIQVPVWKFDFLAENYVVIPEYNRNACLQFHNLDVIGNPLVANNSDPEQPQHFTVDGVTYTGKNDVYCDINNNAILYNPGFSSHPEWDWWYFRKSGVVDMDTDQPTLEDRIEALRFKVLCPGNTASFPGGGVGGVFYSLPDHYVTFLLVWTTPSRSPIFISDNLTNGLSTDYEWVAKLSQFNMAPLLYVNRDYVIGDLNFSTQIDYEYLAKLNKVIYSGLFNFRVS